MRKYDQEMARAWENFVTAAVVDLDIVPEIIAESWKRCRKAGIDPYDGVKIDIMPQEELNKLRSKMSTLISITRPFMENLYNFVAGSGFIVILSDENGNLLETLGDPGIYKKALEVNLIPGGNWREEAAGTNGIGTALVLGKPVQVSGKEHYCWKIHNWTCSAAPIYGENNKILGALQMSGPSHASHKHTLGMVVAAVKAIEEQLRVERKNRELTLVNSRINSIFNTMSDGVMVVDCHGVVERVNPSAERILGRNKSKIEGVRIEDVFEHIPKMKEILNTGKPFSNLEVMSQSEKSQTHCLVSGEAVKDDQGRNIGGVLIISPINKIKKLVNRFSGAEARFEFKDIVGSGPDFQEAVRIAGLAAGNDSNILLEGESGTGKEVFAQAIHNASHRRNGPFIALNCGAIPRELLGSELFGYADGALLPDCRYLGSGKYRRVGTAAFNW